MGETVLTTRRAVRIGRDGAVAGRLRVSDRTVRFLPADGSSALEIPLAAVRRIAVRRTGRAALLIESRDASLRLRCFGARAVALLLLQAVPSPGADRPAAAAPPVLSA